MNANRRSITNTELPAEASQAIERARWGDIPPGISVEVVSVRGNKRRGTFHGVREDGILLILEAGKSNLSHLLQDQLQSVLVFGEVLLQPPDHKTLAPVVSVPGGLAGTSIADALPGTPLSLDDLLHVPLGSRLELISVRGNPRAGLFRGLTPNRDIHFVPDGDDVCVSYPRCQLSSLRLLANGPEQVVLQQEIVAVLRREFQRAALAFASSTDEMRGVVVVDGKSGRIVEVLTKRSIEFDTLTWDADGLLREEFVEYTVRVNIKTGAFDLRHSAATPPAPLVTATVRQCVADFVRELQHPGRSSL